MLTQKIRGEYVRWLEGYMFTEFVVLTIRPDSLLHSRKNGPHACRRALCATLALIGYDGPFVAVVEGDWEYHIHVLMHDPAKAESLVRAWGAVHGHGYRGKARAGAVRYIFKSLRSDDDLDRRLELGLTKMHAA